MSESYTVEDTPRGRIVRGSVPICAASALLTGGDPSWDIVDALIAEHIGAVFVVTSREESQRWREELGLEVRDG